jgi:N-acetylmuramoyl-L-alanine amidase
LEKLLNRVLAGLLAGFCGAELVLSQDLELEIVYPRENMMVTAADSTFVFGHVNHPQARVEINSIAAQMFDNGTFLGMVPVLPGNFSFYGVATLDSQLVQVRRRVYIPFYLITSPSDSLTIDTSYVFPAADLALQAGDMLTVVCKGTPGCRATFSIDGLATNLPMSEMPPKKQFYWGEAVFGQGRPSRAPEVEGIYSGVYIIQPGDSLQNAAITFTLHDSLGDSVKTVAPGGVSTFENDVPRIARLTQELTVARTAPRKGHQLYLPEGIRLWIIGADGDYYRARLVDDESVWVPAANVEFLSPGTLPPRSDVRVARTSSFEKFSRVTIFLDERVPFKIEQINQPQRLYVILYGVTADTDYIRHDFSDPLIGDIRWSQESEERYRLSIDLNLKQQWGYRAYFDDNNLIVDIKKTPEISSRHPLRDLLVCVDPGHGPDLGAIGPTGKTEREATLELAKVVAERLEERGARVMLTRDDPEGIALTARPKLAEVAGADVLLSLHYNALPDGVDPNRNRGSSAYYFHPQSYKLAEAILRRLLRKLKLPNFGLYYENLAVCRVTSMPAALLEPAFLMHPLEEVRILDAKFREDTATAIIQGLEDFVKLSRE